MCASLLLMLVTYSSRFEVLHFILVDSNHTLFASGSVRVREFLTRRFTTILLLNSALHYVILFGQIIGVIWEYKNDVEKWHWKTKDKVGKPSKQRCTQEIQGHIGQRYAYERMAAGRKVKNGTWPVIRIPILVKIYWVITHYGKLVVVFPAEYHVFSGIQGLFYSLG